MNHDYEHEPGAYVPILALVISWSVPCADYQAISGLDLADI